MFKKRKYRNITGAVFNIPVPGNHPELVGNIIGWQNVDNNDCFDAIVDDQGLPINPSLRVAAKASRHGIEAIGKPFDSKDPVAPNAPKVETHEDTENMKPKRGGPRKRKV
jgi:hypothetical protein